MNNRSARVGAAKDAENELAYSTPIDDETPTDDVITLGWNTILVTVIIVMVSLSRDEESPLPLRLWLGGYGALCIFHMGCVVFEYRGKKRSSIFYSVLRDFAKCNNTSVAKLLHVIYNRLLYTWWLCGFVGVCVGLSVVGHTIAHDAPKLFWLCVTILAIDVFSVVIVVCIIGTAVSFFLTFAIACACAYHVKGSKSGDYEKESGEIQESKSSAGIMTESNTDPPVCRTNSSRRGCCKSSMDS